MVALLLTGLATVSAGNLLTGLAWAVIAAFTLQALRGVGIATLDVAANTMLQQTVPAEVLGRVERERPPAAADVKQCHAWLEAQLPQRQVDLGDLRFFQRHVVALEVGAAVGLRRIEEEPEELVGQVVVRLHVLEVRLETLVGVRLFRHAGQRS